MLRNEPGSKHKSACFSMQGIQSSINFTRVDMVSLEPRSCVAIILSRSFKKSNFSPLKFYLKQQIILSYMKNIPKMKQSQPEYRTKYFFKISKKTCQRGTMPLPTVDKQILSRQNFHIFQKKGKIT